MRLRELGLASILALTSCQTPSETVPQAQVEQSVDNVVKDALAYFQNKEYGKTQGLLEQHKNHQTLENKQVSASARCLLAMTYAVNWKFNDSQSQFWSVMHEFMYNPRTIDQVSQDFQEFFKTKQYKDLEKQLDSYARFYPRLSGVMTYLKLAQNEYSEAAGYFSKARKHFDSDTVERFTAAIQTRWHQAQQEGDIQKTIGYALLVNQATIQK